MANGCMHACDHECELAETAVRPSVGTSRPALMRQGEAIMNEQLRSVLVMYGFATPPWDDAESFRWADGVTAVYVERCERTGRYMVTTYRPYGTQTFHRAGLSARDAVALALAETTADRRIGRVAVPA